MEPVPAWRIVHAIRRVGCVRNRATLVLAYVLAHTAKIGITSGSLRYLHMMLAGCPQAWLRTNNISCLYLSEVDTR